MTDPLAPPDAHETTLRRLAEALKSIDATWDVSSRANDIREAYHKATRPDAMLSLLAAHAREVAQLTTDRDKWKAISDEVDGDVQRECDRLVAEAQARATTAETQAKNITHCGACGTSWYADGFTGSCPTCALIALREAHARLQADHDRLRDEKAHVVKQIYPIVMREWRNHAICPFCGRIGPMNRALSRPASPPAEPPTPEPDPV